MAAGSYYRGGNSLKTKPREVKIDPVTGLVQTQRGVSVFDRPENLDRFGGAFLLTNTGRKPAKSQHRLVTTIAWALKSDDYTYALEGSAFIAGAAVQWFRDGLKLIKNAAEIENLVTLRRCEAHELPVHEIVWRQRQPLL